MSLCVCQVGCYQKRGNMSGYTQIVDWNPSSIPCTESERTEIDRLLKEGVIL